MTAIGLGLFIIGVLLSMFKTPALLRGIFILGGTLLFVAGIIIWLWMVMP